MFKQIVNRVYGFGIKKDMTKFYYWNFNKIR